jgi:hypothetical protein
MQYWRQPAVDTAVFRVPEVPNSSAGITLPYPPFGGVVAARRGRYRPCSAPIAARQTASKLRLGASHEGAKCPQLGPRHCG